MCEQFDEEDPLGAPVLVTSVSAIRQRLYAMAKADFCRMMRSTNSGQTENTSEGETLLTDTRLGTYPDFLHRSCR
ncbi:hypothetical protein TNCT_698541 [Trichonephila clavata]|uniref:Uncharacterized protein n=1 Tax=Trichonephila clavata TaxID=2740835 RepID=A0A8X6KQA8_TRICU|nr:hypothetical protein TNCT_698541 [Trichonephila clavata]